MRHLSESAARRSGSAIFYPLVIVAVLALLFSVACDDAEMMDGDPPGAEAAGDEPVVEGGDRPHFPEVAEEAEERAAEAQAEALAEEGEQAAAEDEEGAEESDDGGEADEEGAEESEDDEE